MYIHACIVNVHYNYSMNCYSITQNYFISSQGSGWVSWIKKKANMDFRNGMCCHDKEPDHLSLLIFLMHLSYELFISQRTHVTIKLPVSCSVGHLKKKYITTMTSRCFPHSASDLKPQDMVHAQGVPNIILFLYLCA